MEIQQAICAIF